MHEEEPFSPELVLVTPELRLHAPYGPVYPTPTGLVEAAPAARVALDTPRNAPISILGTIEVTARVPVLSVVLLGALWEIVVVGAAVIGGIALAIFLLVLLSS
jgi:hypothetical protein